MTRPSSRRAPRAAGVAALATVVVLAGCSGGDPVAPTPTTPSATTAAPSPTASPSETEVAPTVAEVYRAARTSALSAASGHAEGSQTREGRTLTIDVEGVANGSNQTVFITTDTGTAEVLTVGEEYWLGGDEGFWVEQTGDARAGAGMVGKYVPITESDATELGSFTLRSILTEKFSLPEFAAFESDTTPAESTEVDGRAAYVLGAEGGARRWVAADGSGALLRAVGPKSAPSDLVFTEWDRAQKFGPPPPSKVLDEG
ncbi:MAG TPA: hypothetical protein VFI44_00890 [Ornithinibacter sp.]|nr:hypothetical protein [Ornithinibacter sp.]